MILLYISPLLVCIPKPSSDFVEVSLLDIYSIGKKNVNAKTMVFLNFKFTAVKLHIANSLQSNMPDRMFFRCCLERPIDK